MALDGEFDDRENIENGHAFLEARTMLQNQVVAKRKEQLKKWEHSELNQISPKRRPIELLKVKFQENDVFLSACRGGDIDEIQQLLDRGSDINASSIDGVTSLHQAVIDGDLEVVSFLIENDANINAQDNEGWTPLHAAVCCGNMNIVKFLCEHNADLTLVNCDKELAVDLAEDDDVRTYLESELRKREIDQASCREIEYQKILDDARIWISDGRFEDIPHPKSGATALHVAASKGYNRLIGMLIKAGGSVLARDLDGWTPLHAAAHWGQKDACRILMENGATIDALTCIGQDVQAVADRTIVEYLIDLKKNFDELRSSAFAEHQLHQKNLKTHRQNSSVINNFVEGKKPIPSREASSLINKNRKPKSELSEDGGDAGNLQQNQNSPIRSIPSSSSVSSSASISSSTSSSASPTPSPLHMEPSIKSANYDALNVNNNHSNKLAPLARISFESSSPFDDEKFTADNGCKTDTPLVSFAEIKHVEPLQKGIVIYPLQQKQGITPPTQPTDAKESESERKAMSRLKRQSRRSTQGVTQEQLSELNVGKSNYRHRLNVPVNCRKSDPNSIATFTPTSSFSASGVNVPDSDSDSATSSSTDVHSINSLLSIGVGGAVFSHSERPSDSNSSLDYRDLYARERDTNAHLLIQIQALQANLDIATAAGQICSIANGQKANAFSANKSNNFGEIEVYQQRIRKLNKELDAARGQVEKLKSENKALIHVLTKLSRSS